MVLKKKRAKRSRKGMAWAELRGERYVFLRCLFFFHSHCRRQTVITPDATLVRSGGWPVAMSFSRSCTPASPGNEHGRRYGSKIRATLIRLPSPATASASERPNRCARGAGHSCAAALNAKAKVSQSMLSFSKALQLSPKCPCNTCSFTFSKD